MSEEDRGDVYASGLEQNRLDASVGETEMAAEFQRLHEVVKRGLGAFIEAGSALAEIRDRELWKVGGFKSWGAYCEDVVGLTKVHANRLAKAAMVGRLLSGVEPIGSSASLPLALPRSESQIRPLLRLTDPAQQKDAWARAVRDAGGQQPTAKRVAAAVIAVEGPPVVEARLEDPRGMKLQLLVLRLRRIHDGRDPQDGLPRIISELEEMV